MDDIEGIGIQLIRGNDGKVCGVSAIYRSTDPEFQYKASKECSKPITNDATERLKLNVLNDLIEDLEIRGRGKDRGIQVL